MVEVKKFLKALRLAGGDEETAHRVYKNTILDY
jgi:hypothetical protein